ncbi:unnamed protein product [Paramecium octaurelia]|uniref:Uncharacterized protein n=1 Tax=Paramecium octaurelia TaxID=43137 RepID=A0A8S1X338_PAROT|nr:unnamed protein product [Paramecium octaurelia]
MNQKTFSEQQFSCQRIIINAIKKKIQLKQGRLYERMQFYYKKFKIVKIIELDIVNKLTGEKSAYQFLKTLSILELYGINFIIFELYYSVNNNFIIAF